ncbi:MAG: autotransporter domain-containing protein [Burkholderiaceae bacterium]
MNKPSALVLAALVAVTAQTAAAYDSKPILRPDGEAIFELRFFGVGDGPFMPNGFNPPEESTWNLNADQKSKIATAMQYWAEVIRPASGQLPTVINIGTIDVDNAFGTGGYNEEEPVALTKLQAALQGRDPRAPVFGSQAQFAMGKLDWDTVAYLPSQVPPTGKFDVMVTALHELAHGLGISSSLFNKYGPATPHFQSPLLLWDTLLRDDNGKPARLDQAVLCGPCANAYDPDAFDARLDRAYLTGKHINEVLAGGLRGVPVSNLGDDGKLDSNYMSHIELKNSMMSHQNYSNYTSFMEAELAVMQDLGYDIDRRNFFGRSIYNDGLTLVNDQGYFQRNALGTAYLPGTYNTAMLGLGLHVYGSRNTVYQSADLLSKGAGGAGIRVDGRDNTIVVQPGTRIHADGLNGRGLLFAYGRDHTLVQRGDVQALGPEGVAVSFDFGNNSMGNAVEYRGSYIQQVRGTPVATRLDELNGALVDRYDLTGRLAGSAAAIYMSPSALVNQINVMRGAQIQGDIVSHYQQTDEHGAPRLTQLSFGLLPDAAGRATGQPDAAFSLRYQNNIQGSNIALSAQGGYTSLNGNHDLHSVRVHPNATLAGNSRYTVQAGQRFTNDGTVSPGNSIGRIDIVGDYQQGPTGKLKMEVDAQGGHDILSVSGNALLDGQLALSPLQDWYATTWSASFDKLIQAGTTTGAFNTVLAVSSSPTLSFQALQTGGGAYRLTATRPAQAYSRYARNDNDRGVGQALDRISGIARPDIQPLYKTLDFSAPDGSDIAPALEPLSPAAYSTLFAASLQRERLIAQAAGDQQGTAAQPEGQWRAHATTFGAGAWQQRRDDQLAYDASTYGAVFGAQSRRKDWDLGIYGALSQQTVTLRDPERGKGRSNALHLGVQARHAPDPRSGPFVFGQGQIGIEEGKLDRYVTIGQYQGKHKSDWTGYSGALSLGAGYKWALSPAWSAGPVASLDYAYLHRPALTESGSAASRLALEAAGYSSLRSSLGIGASLNLPLQNEAKLTATMQVAWEHELLNRAVTQTAYFTGYPDQAFSTRNTIASADALGVRGALHYAPTPTLDLSASLSSQFLRSGYRSIAGNLALNWKF